MKIPGVVLLVLFYAVLPLAQAGVYIVVTAAQGLTGEVDWLFSANYLMSITAYHWMLANVLLSLKIPVWQNLLPYDLRVRLHIYSTMGLCFLLAWHAVHTIVLNFGGVDLVSWALIPLFLVLVVLSGLWIPLPGLKNLAVGQAYDFFKASHKLLFLVVSAAAWWHISDKFEIFDPNQSAHMPVWSAWGYQGLFVLTAAAYLYTRFRDGFFLPVVAVRSVVAQGGITRLTLEGHPRLKYHSGQFAFLRFLVPGMKDEEHPFSFTSTPGDETVGFAIRELGDFTRQIAALKPGVRVKVNAGFGSFSPIHRGRPGRPLALIGSGIGAAPLISILKDLGRNEPHREVVYLQAYTTRDEFLEPETVAALQTTMPRLTVKTYVYHEDQVLYGEALFRQELPDPRKYDIFLCSSPRVRAVAVPALRALGIRREHIHYEAFHLG